MNKNITSRYGLLTIFSIVVVISSILIYINSVRYVEIYKAIAGVDVNVVDVYISNYTDELVIYVKLSIRNPSDLNIKFVGIGGHIKINDIYLGQLVFGDRPDVIGKNSINVTILGAFVSSDQKEDIIIHALDKGVVKWFVYGWASFEVSGQWLMVEYKSVIK